MNADRKTSDLFDHYKGFLAAFGLLVAAYVARVLLGRRLAVDDGGNDNMKMRFPDGVRLGFLIAILFCLVVMLAVPVVQIKASAGFIMLGLSFIYMLVENRMGRSGAPLKNEQKRPSITSTGAIDERLKRLRRAYYKSREGDLKTRAFDREMQKIDPSCHRYYERMMETEASVVTLLNAGKPQGIDPKELMRQVQTLSRQIAVMVEQLQLADQLAGFYDKGTDEDIMVQRARRRLIRRADRAMGVLEGMPARLLQLTTATSSQGLTRLVEDLRYMNERLEGRAMAYEAMAADHEPSIEELYAHLEMQAKAREHIHSG
ncbi:MAG: hypothetical protein JXB47_17805 [Anaerolineae bacterium]|nr:hypothetical protein [Anaerolineae bacterium]